VQVMQYTAAVSLFRDLLFETNQKNILCGVTSDDIQLEKLVRGKPRAHARADVSMLCRCCCC